MDLKNNKIMIGELLDYPPAVAAFKKRFPLMLRHPVTGAARTVTLEQALDFARDRMPPQKLNELVEEWKRI